MGLQNPSFELLKQITLTFRLSIWEMRVNMRVAFSRGALVTAPVFKPRFSTLQAEEHAAYQVHSMRSYNLHCCQVRMYKMHGEKTSM